MVYSIILVILVSIFNAVQDTLYSHFSTSIFRKLDPKFWKALESWAYCKRILDYPIDAWHISKSLFLMSFIASIVLYSPLFGQFYDFLLLGVIYNLVFNLFYVNLLRK